MGILQKVCACTESSISVLVHKRKGCMHVNQMHNQLLENGYVHACNFTWATKWDKEGVVIGQLDKAQGMSVHFKGLLGPV